MTQIHFPPFDECVLVLEVVVGDGEKAIDATGDLADHQQDLINDYMLQNWTVKGGRWHTCFFLKGKTSAKNISRYFLNVLVLQV